MSWFERGLWLAAVGAFYITAVWTYNATVEASVIYFESANGAEVGACYLDAASPLLPQPVRSWTCVSGPRFGRNGNGLGLRIGITRTLGGSDGD